MERVRLLEPPRWSEARIASLLAGGLLSARSALVIPNCNWTGRECDLLVIEPGLRIIDVEIKISRSDLRADIKKDKWWKSRPWSRRSARAFAEGRVPKQRERREWPDKVWKHYYALPESVWAEPLLACIPEASGVLLLREAGERLAYTLLRRAKPNRDAKPICASDAIDLARLASLRMWSALTEKEKLCPRK